MSKKIMILILALLMTITVACVAAVTVILTKQDEPTILAPDYAPIEEDPNAENIPNDTEDKLEQPEGGGAVSLIYTTNVTIDLSDGKALLLFGNPQKSNQDMVVQIVVKGHVVVQSGRLTPGKQVTTLDLAENTPALGEGTYTDDTCTFVVCYYDPMSGEKAMLNTEIPITVTVRE